MLNDDDLFTNPFTNTNPLDAILNFGNAINSNNYVKSKLEIPPEIPLEIPPEPLDNSLEAINIKNFQNKSRLGNIPRLGNITKSIFGKKIFGKKFIFTFIFIIFIIFILKIK